VTVALLEFQIEHPYFHRLTIDEVVNPPKAEGQPFFRKFTAQGIESCRNMERLPAGGAAGLMRASLTEFASGSLSRTIFVARSDRWRNSAAGLAGRIA
jgi:hypothetical protein